MQTPEVGNQYIIIVNRKGSLDEMIVQVELKNEAFSDKMTDMMMLKSKIEAEMKKYLNIAVKVDLKEPETLPRFEGKAKRVIDNRVL